MGLGHILGDFFSQCHLVTLAAILKHVSEAM
jgi:hypothetical protein